MSLNFDSNEVKKEELAKYKESKFKAVINKLLKFFHLEK